MRREALALALATSFAIAASGCRKELASKSACSDSDPDTVACVDGARVSRTFVEQFVREPWWVPGSSKLPDARDEATQRAIRTMVFAAEAKRRKLPLPPGAPDVPASWSQALVSDELSKRGVSRDAISDGEAAKYYADNQELFNQVDAADVQVIAFSDPVAAEKLHAEATKSDTEGFRALALAHSVDEKTKAKGGDRSVLAAPDEDRAMLKMVLSVRKPGVLAGPFRASDGRWYLLRIKSSPLEHAKPFDDVMKATVKNALLDRRRQQLVDELDLALRPRAKIDVFPPALARITVPKFE